MKRLSTFFIIIAVLLTCVNLFAADPLCGADFSIGSVGTYACNDYTDPLYCASGCQWLGYQNGYIWYKGWMNCDGFYDSDTGYGGCEAHSSGYE